MRHKRKIASFFFFPLLLFLFPPSSLSADGYRASIKLNVNDSIINLEASEVALGDVLRAICEKMGMRLNLGDPLGETVSFSLTAMPAEEVFKRLLASRSYTVSFKKTSDEKFIPVELFVVGNRLAGSMNVSSFIATEQSEIGGHPRDAHVKKMQKEQYVQQFGNTESLLKQLEAVPVGEGSFARGIRITNIDENSPLLQIGIVQGDIIEDVNGRPVQSARQFLQSLPAANMEQSIVRIERKRNGITEPIYIETL